MGTTVAWEFVGEFNSVGSNTAVSILKGIIALELEPRNYKYIGFQKFPSGTREEGFQCEVPALCPCDVLFSDPSSCPFKTLFTLFVIWTTTQFYFVDENISYVTLTLGQFNEPKNPMKFLRSSKV